MTRFADPARCPDCRAAITPGAAACTVCALSLQGDTAHRLFRTLSAADLLLAELRAASVPTTTPAVTSAAPVAAAASGPTAFPHTSDLPAYDAPAPAPHGGLSAASVPRILLGLGAACLLVAALVFLAVTWSVMGVGGRTATLVGFTAVASGLAGWLARRGLRAAAESVALVGYGLLTLDVLGADHAGWFGDLGTAGLLAVLGAVLASAATAGTLTVRRATGTGLVGAEVVLGVGVALGVVAFDLGEWLPQSASLVLGTVLALVVVLATRQARLHVAEVATAVVAGCAWLALTTYALAQVADHSDTWR